MGLELDSTAVAGSVAALARRFGVGSVLHAGARTGFLGAVLRQSLDFGEGRLTPCERRARLTALVESGESLPFGFCYDVVEAERPEKWLGRNEARFEMILAPRAALEMERDAARELLKLLYGRTDKLLLTVVANDLAGPHEAEMEGLYTLQMASADFARVGFTEMGPLALAAIRNEFLPL